MQLGVPHPGDDSGLHVSIQILNTYSLNTHFPR